MILFCYFCRNGSIINTIYLVFDLLSAPGNTDIINVLARASLNIANFSVDLNYIIVNGTVLTTQAPTTTVEKTTKTAPSSDTGATTISTSTKPFLSTALPESTTPITTTAPSKNTTIPTTTEVPTIIFTVIATFTEPFVPALTNRSSPEFKVLEAKAVALVSRLNYF